MCNWKKWFLPGLVTVVLLSALVLWLKADLIESDLLAKSNKALEKNSFSWVQVEMDGRDAIVTGLAPSEELQSQAASLIDDAYDVRTVESRTDLMEAQSPYIFGVEKSDNIVIVSGYAPDDPTRTAIIAATEEAVPSARVVSKVALARGAPSEFSVMTKFGIGQLAGLSDGRVDWSDQDMRISGTAFDQQAYKSINAALSGELPGGLKLTESDISAPLASPYTWAVNYDGTQATLTGHVPSETVRKDILQSAKTALPAAMIVDELLVASGEAETFKPATEFSLQQLARFSNGSVAISDVDFSITGVALDAASYVAVKQAVSSALPAGMSLAGEAISPATISPYRWAANFNGNEVTLTGFVPDVAVRQEITARVRSALSNLALNDEMQIADGAPATFSQATSFALGQLPRFVSGKVSLSDLDLSVEGVALDPTAYREASAEIENSLPASMTLASRNIMAPTVSPYLWSTRYDGKTLILQGFVSNDIAREAILRTASKTVPQAAVEDRMQLAAGAPQQFTEAAGFALAQLKHLAMGSVALSDLALTVNGVAADSESFDDVKKAISGDLPVAISLANENIEPPVVSPYRWAADYDGASLLLNGFVSDDDIRASITRAAKTALPDAEIQDRMQTAKGEPERFSEVTEFALARLKWLESGFVSLSDLDLVVKGVAIDPNAYLALKKSVDGELPFAMKLFEQDIKASQVSPYIWSAAYDGGTVVLQGFVPDEAAREKLVAAAANALPAVTVTDQMQIATGAPETYDEVTAGAIAVLPRFSQGSVELSELDLTVKGTAKSTSAYPEAESYLTGNLPGGMRLAASNIQPPAASGEYLWQASMSGDAVILEGSVPSKEARAQIEEKTRDAVPDKRIDNRMVIEAGAPEDFVVTASKLLKILDNFSIGIAQIKGTSVDVTGEAKTVASYENALEAISGSAGAGFSWGKKNVRPATISPYSWWVEKHGDGSRVGGFVPNTETSETLADSARSKFGKPVENRQRLAGGTPEGFEKATSALIDSVSMLKDAKGTISGTIIEIEGRAPSESEAGIIASNLEVDLPSGFRLRKRITYASPQVQVEPKPEPAQPVTKSELQTSEPEPDSIQKAVGKKSEPQPAAKVAKIEPAPQPKPVAAPKPCNVDFKSLFRGEKILFATARAVILDESEFLLSRIAQAAKQCEGALIEVGGHTDSRGTRRYNRALSKARATAVVSYLTRQGVPRERLVAKGYGETKPIASNRRPKTRLKNRRIEFRTLRTN